MATLDAFKHDAFTSSNLTAAVNMLPFKPSRIGSLNLFKRRRVRTTTVLAEEKQGKISLLNTAARGDRENVKVTDPRKARNFTVPHVPQYGRVMADDVQNIRAYGSESELESLSGLVNEELMGMRTNHEVTHEWHRIGALKGTILDGDATTTIYNLYTEFGLTQKTVDINFSTPDVIKTKFTNIIREIEDGMGGTPFDGIHAVVGNTWWDNFIASSEVKTAYERWQDGAMLREQQRAMGVQAPRGFPYAGITLENYRGSVGGTKFVPDAEAYFFPVGTPDDTFVEVVAPANFAETVNTLGQLIYAKQERMPFDVGIDLHSQSNVLYLCTRLDALVKSTGTFS